jgi:hypothetical protein
MTKNKLHRLLKRVITHFGTGYSYHTAVFKVARKYKLDTGEQVHLWYQTVALALRKKQITRKQATALTGAGWQEA